MAELFENSGDPDQTLHSAVSDLGLHCLPITLLWVSRLIGICLFVLRFYSPVNPVGSCQARSVYLTTRLLGRLSPLSG